MTDDPIAALMADAGRSCSTTSTPTSRTRCCSSAGCSAGGRTRRAVAVATSTATASTSSITDADGDARRAHRVRRAGHRRRWRSPARCSGSSRGPARSRARPGETSAERQMAEMAGDPHVPHDGRRPSRTSTRTCGSITFAGGDLATFAPLGPDTFLLRPAAAAGPDRADDRPVLHVGGRTRHDAARTSSRSAPTTRCGRGDPTSPSSTCCSSSTATRPRVRRGRRRAAAGDPSRCGGRAPAYHPPAGTDWLLLVADETGLPGRRRDPRAAPDGHARHGRRRGRRRGTSTRSSPSARRRGHVAAPRRRRPAGTTTLLADAVRALPWPAGRPYVWGGGEPRTMTAIRRHVRHERGLERAAVSLVAYWRHPSSPPE